MKRKPVILRREFDLTLLSESSVRAVKVRGKPLILLCRLAPNSGPAHTAKNFFVFFLIFHLQSVKIPLY